MKAPLHTSLTSGRNPDTEAATIVLVLIPKRERGGYHLDRFRAHLDDGTHIVTSRQPLFDGARELLKLGFDPGTMLTVRHDGCAPSFKPRPIGWLAQWTVAERDKSGLQLARWRSPATPEQRAVPAEEGVRTGEDVTS